MEFTNEISSGIYSKFFLLKKLNSLVSNLFEKAELLFYFCSNLILLSPDGMISLDCLKFPIFDQWFYVNVDVLFGLKFSYYVNDGSLKLSAWF